MQLRIHLLQHAQAVRDRLERDGWRLGAGAARPLSACHPEVATQADARQRLHALGLLTSASLRVEFSHPAPGRAGSQPGFAGPVRTGEQVHAGG
jgi:hypothetical protein